MRALPAVLVVSCLLLASGCNCDGGGPQDGGSGGGVAVGGGGGGGGGAGGGSGGGATGGGGGEPGDGGLAFRLGPVEAVVSNYFGLLWLVQPDGTATLLANTEGARGSTYPGMPRWSPDGTRVAFTNLDVAFVTEPDGGYRQVVQDRGGKFRAGGTFRGEWSADGLLVVDGIDNDSDATAVFLPAPDGGEPRYLGWADGWAWAPDRRTLLVSALLTSEGKETVYRLDLATGDAGVVRPGRLLDASPRGAIAVREERTGDAGPEPALVVYLADGGSSLLFPQGTLDVASEPRAPLALSPYADEAAGVVVDRAGRFHFVRVSFQGAVVDYLQAASPGFLPTCFRFVPGGHFLSFIVPDDPSTLFLGSPDGGAEVWELAVDPSGPMACLDWRLRR